MYGTVARVKQHPSLVMYDMNNFVRRTQISGVIRVQVRASEEIKYRRARWRGEDRNLRQIWRDWETQKEGRENSWHWGRNMSDIPLGVKLSPNSLFSSYSNTLMHTDNCSTTACPPAAHFNQNLPPIKRNRQVEGWKWWEKVSEKHKEKNSLEVFFLVWYPVKCRITAQKSSAVIVCKALICRWCHHLHISKGFWVLCIHRTESWVKTQKWAVSARTRRLHNAIYSYYKWLTEAARLICHPSHYPLSYIPASRHLFNFDTQYSTCISLMETCGKRFRLGAWPSAGWSGEGGGNFKLTSFSFAISGQAVRLVTGPGRVPVHQ